MKTKRWSIVGNCIFAGLALRVIDAIGQRVTIPVDAGFTLKAQRLKQARPIGSDPSCWAHWLTHLFDLRRRIDLREGDGKIVHLHQICSGLRAQAFLCARMNSEADVGD